MLSSTRQPRTILFFDHTAEMSGGEIALLHLVQHLDRARFTPLVVLGSHGPLVQKLLDSGIETHIFALPQDILQTRKDSLRGRSLLQIRQAAQLLRYCLRLSRFIARRADIVHANSLKADIIGGVAARLARVPVIWHVRDRIADDYLPSAAVRAFRWLCVRLPNYVVANSQATMDTIFPPPCACATNTVTAMKSRDSTPRRILYSGVTLHESQVDEQNSNNRVLDSGAPRIGLVGRISPWKGQHIFVHAAAEISHDHPKARFLIIGSAMFGEEDYEAAVRRQAHSYDLNEQLEWTGFRTDVQDVIESLDILVHASTMGEPFGQVILQGMAAGKPVVATRGGGVPEIVRHGETGLLVPMNSSRDLSDAVLQLLSDPERAREMGRQAQHDIRQKFLIEHTACGAEEVYDFLLKRCARR